jgi:hypothetical protein
MRERRYASDRCPAVWPQTLIRPSRDVRLVYFDAEATLYVEGRPLAGWEAHLEDRPSLAERVDRITYYARFDA